MAPLLTAQPANQDQPKVQVVPDGKGGFQLLREGKPYFIKGVGGGRAKMDKIVELGGNSVRTWSPDEDLMNRAHEHGLAVMCGIPLGHRRWGFDYGDPEQVARQLDEARQTVRRLRNHPALLIWGVGNETALGIDSRDDRILIWKALNDIIEMIHEEDPNHPSAIVVAGLSEEKLTEIREFAPALDLMAVNSYGDISYIPGQFEKFGWKFPYIVTEFGPIGHWASPKTPWGLPIEQTSSEKAHTYLKAYQSAIKDQPLCLGSFAFLWGHKQEKTHTWYGMLLPPDNHLLGPAEAISYGWTGKWPENRTPVITQGIEAVYEDGTPPAVWNTFRAGSLIRAHVGMEEPDGDPLRIVWDFRLDVSDNAATGGDYEPPTETIRQALDDATGSSALIQLPERPGNYRIFVYGYDEGQDHAATANLPIRVVAVDGGSGTSK